MTHRVQYRDEQYVKKQDDLKKKAEAKEQAEEEKQRILEAIRKQVH